MDTVLVYKDIIMTVLLLICTIGNVGIIYMAVDLIRHVDGEDND